MSLRWTEEEYAEYMRGREKRQTEGRAERPAHREADGCAGAKPALAEGSSAGRGETGRALSPAARVLPNCGGEAEKPADGRHGKYGNRRVEVDGMKFDSRHEADYYFSTLLPMWKGGALRLLARQVPFDLPGGIRYIADYVTVDMDGRVDVIDAKSEATRRNRVYINKKKQMRAIWGIEISEV